MPTLGQKCVAELFGTFVLTFCACGCAGGTKGDPTAASLSFGLTIVAMAYSIGKVSGCHINPAVSIAFLLLGQLTAAEFLGYVLCQFIGGLLGAICVFGFVYMSLKGGRKIRMPNTNLQNEVDFGGATNNILNYDLYGYEVGSVFGGLLTEIVLTLIFVYVILCATSPRNPNGNLAGLIIGGTLTLVHLVGIPITGTSVNPARSFATAITQLIYFDEPNKSIEQIWIWLLGPLLGGILATVLYKFLHDDEQPVAYTARTVDTVAQINNGVDLSTINKSN